MRTFVVLLTLALSTAVCAQDAQNPETLSERSQSAARAVLERALAALGGTASVRAIETIRYRSVGETWDRLQLPTVLPPFEGGTMQETVLLDLANDRTRIDQRERRTGAEFDRTVILTAGSVINYNHRAHAVIPTSGAPYASRYRRLPQLLLRQALDNAGTLRHLGRDDVAGKPHEVITFVTPRSEQVSLYVDIASNLVTKGELLYLDALTGDEASELHFSDYVRVGNQQVPQTLIDRDAGGTTGKFQMQVEINPAVSDASFEVPHEGYVRVEPNPPPSEQVERLAEGVFVMRNVAAPDQHSLVVAFKDHVVVVEAPGSSEGADRLIMLIKKRLPGKPIRYVAPTHHHWDHVGGLRSFIAEGVTVIATPGNREYIERLVQAPRFDRLREQPRKPDILVMSGGRHVLSDGSRTVELIDVGPNPHAREMVIAYLPEQRLLFQADVFIMPYTARPLGPVQDQTRSFANRVRELGLKVDIIVGVHGRTATVDEFAAMTEVRL